MERYCSQCGVKITDDSERFCTNCGNSLSEININENDSQLMKNRKIIIGLLILIIILFSMLIFIIGGIDFRTASTIHIETSSPMTTSDDFKATLTSSENVIEGQEIEITFKNDENEYEYSAKTNSEGVATVHPSVEVGDYEVICTFEGDSKYSPTTVTQEINVKQAEPDYQSFYQTHTFEDTDKNGDGYVLLSDMNIAHTPKNIQNQMFADSDDDNDGKLNHDEYYKFMYKLNYDYHSYGM